MQKLTEKEIEAEIRHLERVYKDYPITLTTVKAAEILGVGESTVLLYARNGLTGYRASAHKKAPFSFVKQDVLRYKAKHRADFLR